MAEFKVAFTSTGGAAVDAQIQSILKGATATSKEIVALSNQLNTSAKSAATFASDIGLSVGQTNQVVASFRNLRASGLTLSETFGILQKETGITATQYKNLVTQLRAADAQAEAYISTQKKSESATTAQLIALQQVNQVATQAATALRAFSGQALSEFIQYEDALTTLRAKANPTTEEMKRLEASILDVALVTSQTPSSAAKAAASFISVGASASQTADNLKTAAQLTDAFREDFTRAAKVVQLGANLFSQFGETAQSVGDKISYISDTSAVASSTGLDEFLQLFSKSAPLAKELGISLDDLIASFAVLRDAGQAPEVAATSLKSLLSTIIDNSEKFDELGVNVFDVNGKFVGLTDVFQQLKNVQPSGDLVLTSSALTDLASQADQSGLSIQQVNDIFGKIGVSSALTLANSYEKVAEKSENLSNQMGTLATKAEIINSSVQGQINLLKGSFESALVDIGRSLSGFTSPVVGAILTLVNAFLEAPKPIKDLVGVTIGLSTAFAGLVASVTALNLTLKALQAAGTGETLLLIGTQVSGVAKTVVSANTAMALSNADLGQAFIGVGAKAKTTIASLLGIGSAGSAAAVGSAAAGTAAAGASTGFIALATAAKATIVTWLPLAAAFAGVIAAVNLVQASFESSVGPTNRAASATDDLNKKLNDYQKATGKAITATEPTATRMDELTDTVKRLGASVGFTADLLLKTLPFASSASEASASRLAVATGDLQPTLNSLNSEFIRFKETGQLGSDAAQKLVPVIESAKAAINALQVEGVKNNDVSSEQLAIWSQQQQELSGLITEIQGAATSTKGLNKETEDVKKTYQELQGLLTQTIAGIDTDLLKAQTEAYKQFGDNKELLDKRLEELELQSLTRRLEAQKKFLADLNGVVFENQAEKEQALLDAEAAVVQTNLEIEQQKSKQLQEQLEVREEAEKIYREKQEALAQNAYEKNKLRLNQETADLNTALDERIAAENAAIESLNDRTDSINQELELTRLLGEQTNLIYTSRQQALDAQIASIGLQNQAIDQQIEKLRQAGGTQEQINALEQLKIANQNTLIGLEEQKRKLAEEQLLTQQAQERQELAFQQELQRLDLDKQVRQSQINALESEREVLQARQVIKSNELELSEQRRLLNLAKINGATEAELISLQSQVEGAQAVLNLSNQSLALAQQSASLSKEEVLDAQNLRAGFEAIATAQSENLAISQENERAQLRNTQEAERTTAELNRVGQAAAQTARNLDSATNSANGLAGAAGGAASEISRAAQEAGVLEKNLAAAGRQLSAFEKGILDNPLLSRTFDSSGKETTLAKRSTTGLGTQYFVGGREVSQQEYESAQMAQGATPRSTHQSLSGFGAREGASKEELEAAIESIQNLKTNTENIVRRMRGVSGFWEDTRSKQLLEDLNQRLQTILTAENQANAATDVIGTRAVGGPVLAKKPYIVGENGPELFVPKSNGSIIPNRPTLGSLALERPQTALPSIPSGGLSFASLTAEIKGLRADLNARPIPKVDGNFTFVNEPNPLAAQLQVLQNQLRAARTI